MTFASHHFKALKQLRLLHKTVHSLLVFEVQAQQVIQHKQISTSLPTAHSSSHKTLAAKEVPLASQSQLLTPLTNCHTPPLGSPAPPSPSVPPRPPSPLLASTGSSCLFSRANPACKARQRLSRLSKPSWGSPVQTVLAATYGHSLKLIRRSLLQLLMSSARVLSMRHRQVRLSCRGRTGLGRCLAPSSCTSTACTMLKMAPLINSFHLVLIPHSR